MGLTDIVYRPKTALPAAVTSSDGRTMGFGFESGKAQPTSATLPGNRHLEMVRNDRGQVEEVRGKAPGNFVAVKDYDE